jgi:hypothetical protein
VNEDEEEHYDLNPYEYANGRSPPVSTTLKCVISLATQFFVIYTVLNILITLNTLFYKVRTGRLQRVFEQATKTVNYAPMLCVLFLAVRMRAIQMTDNQPDHFGLPPDYVKYAMQGCTL